MPYRDAPNEIGVCPRCVQASLARHARAGAAVLACKTCGGIFAERDAVLRMLDGETAALVELAEDATRAPPNPKLVPTDLECPRCGILMAKLDIKRAQIRVDVCAGHGVWFDRWETQLVAQVIGDPETREAFRNALFPA